MKTLAIAWRWRLSSRAFSHYRRSVQTDVLCEKRPFQQSYKKHAQKRRTKKTHKRNQETRPIKETCKRDLLNRRTSHGMALALEFARIQIPPPPPLQHFGVLMEPPFNAFAFAIFDIFAC